MIKLTEKQIEIARRLREEAGLTWEAIGARFGTGSHAVRVALDPEYRAIRNERARVARRRERAEDAQKEKRVPEMTAETRIAFKADVAARLAEIPPDTRSLTARIFGDPIPGDMRRHRVLA